MKDMEKLLIKYIKGEATLEEKRQVIHWLDADPSHMKEYLSMRKLYTISLWSIQTETKTTEKKYFLHTYLQEFIKVAAVLILVFLGSYLFLKQDDSNVHLQTVFVPEGQRVEVILADGTRAWLNSNSTLRFPQHFDEKHRDVELDGEGYFEVVRQGKVPFTVKTNKYNVKVLGTEFNLKAYKDCEQFETSLVKGSVEVYDVTNKDQVLLEPNEMVYVKNGALIKTKLSNTDQFLWKDGIFAFEDETIESLIQKIELYYDMKITLKTSTLKDSRYSGKFRFKNGVEHILKVLQLRHKFKYKYDKDGNIFIY